MEEVNLSGLDSPINNVQSQNNSVRITLDRTDTMWLSHNPNAPWSAGHDKQLLWKGRVCLPKIYTFAYMCMCVCLCMCMCVCVRVSVRGVGEGEGDVVFVCAYVCVCVCVPMYVCLCQCMCACHLCMWVCQYVCVCLCVYALYTAHRGFGILAGLNGKVLLLQVKWLLVQLISLILIPAQVFKVLHCRYIESTGNNNSDRQWTIALLTNTHTHTHTHTWLTVKWLLLTDKSWSTQKITQYTFLLIDCVDVSVHVHWHIQLTNIN